MGLYLNNGEGGFTNYTEKAGLKDQLGGLNCMQTDFNNDGLKGRIHRTRSMASF